MMSLLAQFIMRGRSQGVLVVSTLTILSWLFSVASLLAAAALALPTLRRGLSEGMIIGLGALPIVALSGYWVMGNALESAGFALVIWIPTLIIAQILRETGRLSIAVLSAAAMGMMVTIGFYLSFDDPALFWREQFGALLKPILEQQMSVPGESPVAMTLDLFSRYATGAVSAGSVLSVLISLLIARWWQAGLYHPGGFRQEFLALRLGKPSSAILLLLFGLVAALGGDSGLFLANVALPGLMGFIVTGFAVLHAVCGAYPAGRFWLMGVYIGLMFMTPLLLLIALLGASDAWIEWRLRFAGGKS